MNSLSSMDTPSSGDPPNSAENPCKDYWAFKRKRKRETKRKNKLDENTSKVAKGEETATPSNVHDERPKNNSKKWKHMDISEINFSTPTIVIDLSFGDKMSEKVRTSLFSLPSSVTA